MHLQLISGDLVLHIIVPQYTQLIPLEREAHPLLPLGMMGYGMAWGGMGSALRFWSPRTSSHPRVLAPTAHDFSRSATTTAPQALGGAAPRSPGGRDHWMRGTRRTQAPNRPAHITTRTPPPPPRRGMQMLNPNAHHKARGCRATRSENSSVTLPWAPFSALSVPSVPFQNAIQV